MTEKQCDLCKASCKMTSHEYDGKFIGKYNLFVCLPCYRANDDGWARHFEDKILNKINLAGLPIPKRNEKDLIPRD